jgi:hypothetical protein
MQVIVAAVTPAQNNNRSRLIFFCPGKGLVPIINGMTSIGKAFFTLSSAGNFSSEYRNPSAYNRKTDTNSINDLFFLSREYFSLNLPHVSQLIISRNWAMLTM